MLPSRISILGAGAVGTAVAYSLLVKPVVNDILLVDPREELRDAQVEDLKDASLCGVQVRAGTYRQARDSSIIIITQGYRQKPGEPRTALLSRNLKILNRTLEEMKPFHSDTIIIVVANPVDLLTYYTQQVSGLPKEQIIGSGTFLDTKRLKGVLSRELNVTSRNINGYVIGEHGETQVVAWSSVTIENKPLHEAFSSRDLTIDPIILAAETRDKAGKMIKAKGSTSFGVGALTASLCRTIMFNEQKVRPVSYWVEELQCCLSLPVVLGRRGIVRELDLVLTKDERQLLNISAATMRGLIMTVARDECDKNPEATVTITELVSVATPMVCV